MQHYYKHQCRAQICYILILVYIPRYYMPRTVYYAHNINIMTNLFLEINKFGIIHNLYLSTYISYSQQKSHSGGDNIMPKTFKMRMEFKIEAVYLNVH